jgi:hypothetical protein
MSAILLPDPWFAGQPEHEQFYEVAILLGGLKSGMVN